MVKKAKKEKSERVTRKQRKQLQKSSFSVSDDPEDLDAQLKSMGLCTKNIAGDGNCLFRSLSDQYYGHDGNHKDIRQQVCQFLRDNSEIYQFFVEDDQSFEHHVDCMSRNATYGGNMELAAFAKMQAIDIRVYQPGLIYVIHGVEEDEKNESSPVLHIAYHSWEHYSSIRNIDGPYSGPPDVNIKVTEDGSIPEEDKDELTSQEKVVSNACPDTDIKIIRKLLKKHKGNQDDVINAIYETQFNQEDIQQNENPQQIFDDNINQINNITDSVIYKEPKDNLDQEHENKSKKEPDALKELSSLLEKQIINEDTNVNIELENNTGDITTTKESEVITMLQTDITKDNIAEDELISQDKTKNNIAVDELLIQDKDKEKKPKIKKLSARDRKELAKRKQKEERVIKQREKAARKNKYKEDEESKEALSSTMATKVASTMKEINI